MVVSTIFRIICNFTRQTHKIDLVHSLKTLYNTERIVLYFGVHEGDGNGMGLQRTMVQMQTRKTENVKTRSHCNGNGDFFVFVFATNGCNSHS